MVIQNKRYDFLPLPQPLKRIDTKLWSVEFLPPLRSFYPKQLFCHTHSVGAIAKNAAMPTEQSPIYGRMVSIITEANLRLTQQYRDDLPFLQLIPSVKISDNFIKLWMSCVNGFVNTKIVTGRLDIPHRHLDMSEVLN